MAGAQADESLLHRCGEQLRFVHRVGREDVEARHDIRAVKLRRGTEIAAVDGDGFVQRGGREMRGECIGQAQRGGKLRPEQAGTQYPERHVRARAGRRLYAQARVVREIGLKLHHVAGELVRPARQCPPHRLRDALVRSGRAAKTQVDTPRKERGQRPELFRDQKRRMVGQHDPARADADGRRRMSDMGQHNGGRGRSDARHAVMFGHPIAVIAQLFGMGGQHGGMGKGGRDVAAFSDGDEIEQGKTGHGLHMGTGPVLFQYENFDGFSPPGQIRLPFRSVGGRTGPVSAWPGDWLPHPAASGFR